MSDCRMRMPDVYIVGAQKSGTTTLFDWIAQHPLVFGSPDGKDFPFFSNKDVYAQGIERLARYSSKAPSGAAVLAGDANIMYVPEAAERLHRHIPAVRLVAILRDPAARCFSSWRYAVERQLEKRTFEAAIRDEMNGVTYPTVYEKRQKDYLEHGRYGAQIDRLLEWYDPRSIKIVLYEDLCREPLSVMREIFLFMGVDPSFQPVLARKNETRGGARFGWLSMLLYRARPAGNPVWEMTRRLIPIGIRTSVRERLVSFNRISRPAPLLADEIRHDLRNYYREDMDHLEKLTGRRLDAWRD